MIKYLLLGLLLVAGFEAYRDPTLAFDLATLPFFCQ